MGRRRLVVLVSALAMLLLGTGLVGALVAATQSEGGREWIRRQLARQLASGVRGTLHLGRLSGSFLTDLGIDSLSIRDPDDSVFLAFGPMHFTYDPRDLLDGRIIVRGPGPPGRPAARAPRVRRARRVPGRPAAGRGVAAHAPLGARRFPARRAAGQRDRGEPRGPTPRDPARRHERAAGVPAP